MTDGRRRAARGARALLPLAVLLVGFAVTTPPAAASDPLGSVTTYPTGVHYPERIASGPDGNIWFTSPENDGIGRITPAGTVTVFGGYGIHDPEDITAGPDGNLWFTNSGNHSIGRITPTGTVTNFPSPGNSPTSITVGPDGNLWFANFGAEGARPDPNGSIGRITPSGLVTDFAIPGMANPTDITAGPDGNLWFTNSGGDSIGRISATGSLTVFTDPGISHPRSITRGVDGNLWFTNWDGDSIGRMTTSGAVTTFADPDVTRPKQITTGPDGNLWFLAEPPVGSTTIVRLTPAGTFTTFTDDAVSDHLRDITAGPDGNLWFLDWPSGIGRITPTGTVSSFTGASSPASIAAGPDGNLWFTSPATKTIGQMTPTGSLTSHTGAGITWPYDITAGPDGNVWFTNVGGNLAPEDPDGSIGRITPAGVVSTYHDPDIDDPASITVGPDGNLWFVNRGSSSIGQITPSGAITTYSGPEVGLPTSITAGPDGNLWFTKGGPDSIARMTTTGAVTTFTGASGASGITAGPDGNLWFLKGSAIGRITPLGTVTTYSSPELTLLTSITAGPDGNLWLTSRGNGAIGRITPTGTITTYPHLSPLKPLVVTAGPGDDIWFTSGSSAIGRIGTRPVPPPGAPTAVSATAGDGTATVTWAPPEDDADVPVLHYTVTMQGGRSCTRTWAPLTCTFTGLPNGVAVTFTVTATTVAGTGPPSTPSAPVTPTICSDGGGPDLFSDVAADHAFCPDIEWMTAEGITAGYPDGTFKPAISVSRQAMASFLWRLHGSPQVTLTAPYFADVSEAHRFYDAIQWMAETGLSTGSPDPAGGKPLFSPSNRVSRQAMAAFLWRDAGRPSATLPSPAFADVSPASPFYAPIQWMADEGISLGTPAASGKPLYLPVDPVSRQAMAAFLHRTAVLLSP